MSEGQLANLILEADDSVSDVVIDPQAARVLRANKLAAAFNAFVSSKQVIVPGAQAGSSTLMGTIEN